MPRFKIRDGATLSHHGAVLEGGSIVDLPRRVGAEFPHLVDEVDSSGALVVPTPPWQDSLATAQPHEHVTLLEQGRAAVGAHLVDALARFAESEAALRAIGAEVDAMNAQLADIATALTRIAAPAVSEAIPSSEPKASRKPAAAAPPDAAKE
jgi:hypothetical protein